MMQFVLDTNCLVFSILHGFSVKRLLSETVLTAFIWEYVMCCFTTEAHGQILFLNIFTVLRCAVVYSPYHSCRYV